MNQQQQLLSPARKNCFVSAMDMDHENKYLVAASSNGTGDFF